MAEKKIRQSNFELLRIVAMFLVLVLHTGYATFGWPKYHQVIAHPDVLTLRIFLEQLSVPAVDIFVLISGWFGIRATAKGAAKLLFQVGFISACALVAASLLGSEFKGGALKMAQSLFDYWFVWSYLLLFLLAPMLNAYLERADRRTLSRWLLLFFTVAALNLVVKYVGEFNLGYSAVFFIGLYLLGHYLRTHIAPTLSCSNARLWGLFLFSWLLPAGLQVLSAYYFPIPWFGALVQINTAYCNPLIVLQAVALTLIFSRWKIQSKTINLVAVSAFSVYVFHQNQFLRPFFFQQVKGLDQHPLWLFLAECMGYLVLVFALSVLIDRLRILVWAWLSKLRLPHLLSLSLLFLFVSCDEVKSRLQTGEEAVVEETDSLPPADLRLALLPTADCLPFYYAAEAGLYENLGLKVAVEKYDAQNDLDSALLGHADGGYVDSLRFVQLSSRSHLRQVSRLHTDCGIVSAASLRLRQAKDLSGRLLLVAPKTLSEQRAYEGVRASGLTASEVMYPHVASFPVALSMVRESQTDAALLPEPFLSLAVKGRAKEHYRARGGWSGVLVLRTDRTNDAEAAARSQILIRGYNQAVDSLNKYGPALTAPLLRRCAGTGNAADSLRLPSFHHTH